MSRLSVNRTAFENVRAGEGARNTEDRGENTEYRIQIINAAFSMKNAADFIFSCMLLKVNILNG
ncbi:MAG: hypothetical protein LBM87_02860 [Ruminococcus sp.]|nr:hypothetical protein [Ruminococcus sp.]